MAPRSLTRAAVAGLAAVALFGSAACGSGFDDNSGDAKQSSGPASLQILIGSSGDAETKAVQDAAAKWARRRATQATVTPGPGPRPAARPGPRRRHPAGRLLRRRRAGSPTTPASAPSSRTATRSATPDDFYESLRTAFTYDGKFYCAPKDFSTLALQINTDLWTKAGLTDADVPTTWDQLTAAARSSRPRAWCRSPSVTPGTGSAPSWCRPAAG